MGMGRRTSCPRGVGVSIRVMERVWRHGPSHPTERLVLLCLADKAADDGRNAFPSMATIAERTALSQRTVERVIDRLVAAGYLLRERRYVGNGRRSRSNLYTIVLGRLEPNPVMVTVLNGANTVTMTGLDDTNTVMVTPSNTVTMTGSDTVMVTGSNTVTMTPDPSHYDPSHYDPSAAAARPPAVPAAAPPAAAAATDMQLLLKQHGFGWNRQTRQLEGCAWVIDEYIAAHVAAAEARGEGRGLVIQRMLGHEQPPAAKGAPAATTATAWEAWRGWLARHGEEGAAATAELDATTRRMIGEFGRDELAGWDAGMFRTQYDLAAANARRAIPAEFEQVVQR